MVSQAMILVRDDNDALFVKPQIGVTDEILLLLSELEAKKTIHKIVSFWIRAM